MAYKYKKEDDTQDVVTVNLSNIYVASQKGKGKEYAGNCRKSFQALLAGEYDFQGKTIPLADAIAITAIGNMLDNGCQMSDVEKLAKITGDIKDSVEININPFEKMVDEIKDDSKY